MKRRSLLPECVLKLGKSRVGATVVGAGLVPALIALKCGGLPPLSSSDSSLSPLGN
ncbi:MAG: hypothetical protein ACUVTH_11670 [Thermogutta sp.]